MAACAETHTGEPIVISTARRVNQSSLKIDAKMRGVAHPALS